MRARLLVLFAIALFFFGKFDSIIAADSSTLQNAKRLYGAGQYDSTVAFIKSQLKKISKNAELEQIIPIYVEALIRTGDYQSVYKLTDSYRQKFPRSEFQARMWYLQGIAYGKESKNTAAVESFSQAFKSGLPQSLDSLNAANIEKICRFALSPQELSIMASRQDLHPRVIEIARYVEIVRLIEIGDFAKAKTNAEAFRKEYPKSKYEDSVKDLANRAKDLRKDQVQVGVLVPVSGEDAEIGKKVGQGIQLAIDIHNSKSSPYVKLLVRDTRGNMVETAKKSWDLINDNSVPVIIGPILSHTATVCAAMVKGKDVVMISPTATDDGIASLDKNIFQMNVTLGTLGKRIAKYSYDNLNIKEYAILAPRSSYGAILANSFKDEIAARKGEVIAEVFYTEGNHDYSAEFWELRSKLLLRYLQKKAAQKGLSPDKFPKRISRSDSIKYADSAVTVGGLFMPAETEDIVLLAPMVNFTRIKAQLLGSSGWYSPKILKDGRPYVDNAVISAVYESDANVTGAQEFKTAYKAKFNADADKIAALGYDAANLVIKALKEAGNEASKIQSALSNTQGYRGVSGVISFDKNVGINNEASVLKITANGFVKVQ